MEQESKLNPMVVVAIVIATVIGGVAGFVIGNNGDTQTEEVATSASFDSVRAVDGAASDVRVKLNNALREHVSLGALALRAAFNGDPNTEAALATLDENSQEVAGLVGAVYGEQAGDQFLTLWRSHIGYFANYTVAAKSGDQAGMDKALADLEGYATDAGAFFNGANEGLPKEAVKTLLVHHRDHVIKVVNAWGAGDYAKSYEEEQHARDQVGEIGDALAAAIVKQSPDMFSGQ
jgi:hypothetical protein